MRALSRRTMLRGLVAGVGASIALPPLEAMFNTNGTAYAGGGAIPVRYGTFFWGSGVRPDRWVPRRTGAEWWRDPNEALTPLAESVLVRDHVSVLTGFNCIDGGSSNHQAGRAIILTGTYDPARYEYGDAIGPSTDFIIASAWEGRTRFRSLDVGISEVGKGGRVVRGTTSFDAGGNPTGAEFSPRRVFDRLFSMGVESGSTGAAVAEVRQSMVDVVRADAVRLRARLGVNDQRRLDAHLDGIRNLERSLEGLEVSRCEAPASPPDGFSADRSHELLEEKNRVMADLVAMAFACDLTRVVSYQYTAMQSDCIFWQVGAEQGSHVLTHDDRGLSDRLAPQYERVHMVTTFVVRNFTALLEALARIPEGDGTVLDNSVIFATSDVSDGTLHNHSNMPILIGGRAGGRLVRGTHIRGGGENTSKIPLTILRTLGLEVDGFGSGAPRATDTYDALLA